MIELMRHIEILLLENECVVIPDFGGFIAHYMPACRHTDDTFSPPIRSIGFNPQLKMNDGMLIQSYMDTYGTDYSDAARILQREVNEFINILHSEGTVDIVNIGTLSLSVHGTYAFTPYNDKIVSPYLYGLDTFEIKQINILRQFQSKPATLSIPEKPRRTYEIRINRTFVRNAVAAVAAILLFFYMSTPVENTYVEKVNYAQLLPAELFGKIEQQSLLTVTLGIEEEKVLSEGLADITKYSGESPETVEIPEVKNIAPASETSINMAVRTKTYHIIVASLAYRDDAQAVVTELKSKGYAHACVLTGENKIRISLMSHADRKEADRQLSELRKDNTYKNAWLLVR